jgi:hypothetical protein
MSAPTMATVAPGGEEWVVDNPRFRAFIGEVNRLRRSSDDPRAVIGAIRPVFARLMAEEGWLPERYQEPAESGMGSGIGTWLLYRTLDGSLALSALVVPPGAQTPVHDHLAWGWSGSTAASRRKRSSLAATTAPPTAEPTWTWSSGAACGRASSTNCCRRPTSTGCGPSPAVASVSLHLLGIDNGCIWRHRFEPEEGCVLPFKSGYVNAPCEEVDGAIHPGATEP